MQSIFCRFWQSLKIYLRFLVKYLYSQSHSSFLCVFHSIHVENQCCHVLIKSYKNCTFLWCNILLYYISFNWLRGIFILCDKCNFLLLYPQDGGVFFVCFLVFKGDLSIYLEIFTQVVCQSWLIVHKAWLYLIYVFVFKIGLYFNYILFKCVYLAFSFDGPIFWKSRDKSALN